MPESHKIIFQTVEDEPQLWPLAAADMGLDEGNVHTSRSSSSGMSASEACRILGLGPNPSQAEVLAAYRNLVSEYHPDRVANLPKEFQAVAHEKMTEINAAYERLK